MHAIDRKNAEKALEALEESNVLVRQALLRLIPIPNRKSHNVAMVLDEAVRSIQDALSELRYDVGMESV